MQDPAPTPPASEMDRGWWSTAGPSLAGLAARIAARQVLIVLILVGTVVLCGTAGLRPWLLDQALLDAAHVRAQAGLSGPLVVEHTVVTEEELQVAVVDPDPSRPFRMRRWVDGGRYWLSLPVERVDLPGEPPDEQHRLVVASAPLLPMVEDVLALVAIYGVVAVLVGVTFRLRLLALMRDALEPLHSGALSAEVLAEAACAPDAATKLRGQRLIGGGEDEAGRFVASVNRLLDRIEAMLDASRRFTGNAAHELRTPLTAIRGELELALRRPRKAGELQRTVQDVYEQVLELGKRVDALLLLARLDSGELDELDRVRVSALSLLRAAAGPRCADSVDAEVAVVPALIDTALDNLVRNAELHGGGLQEARLEHGAGVVRFVVEDEGAGPAMHRPVATEVLFERFNRGPSGARAEGIGLGLSIVAEIARHHGGRAYLEPRRRGGMRAVLELPVAS
ncbi:MAG: sensor histidine kinase [Deltaproteobacteria bacterium]|nr:MAG: sensor histidine kinase [Deltaproteobacteria bacterium]